MRLVDWQTFNQLTCNRCGVCCESMVFGGDARGDALDDRGRVGWWHYRGPLGWLEVYAFYIARGPSVSWFGTQERDDFLWFGQLEPFFDGENWRYRCGHFFRNEAGEGVCQIYERRPKICRDFPSGKPVRGYSGCIWEVEILDFEEVQLLDGA